MKITSLHLKDYHQFGDCKFDFTYGEGHPRAGQPLDKVCFIGPNGSGKTKLMEEVLMPFFRDGIALNEIISLEFQLDEKSYLFTKTNHWVDTAILENSIGKIPRIREIPCQNDEVLSLYLIENKKKIPISEMLGFRLNSFKITTLDNRNKPLVSSNMHMLGKSEEENLGKGIRFDQLVISIPLATNFGSFKYDINQIKDWNITTRRIIKLDQSTSTLLSEKISYLKRTDSDTFTDATEKGLNPDIKKYQRVKDLFLKIEDYLSKSNLKYGGFADGKFYLENTDGHKIEVDDLSSGTKQILYRVLPLQEIKPISSAIFIDEPETSLYPGLQKEIVDVYTKIGSDNQWFFATHSPMVAGQFEKDEVFILYFGEDGKVGVRKPETHPRLLDLESLGDMLYGIERNTPMTQDGVDDVDRLKFLTRNIKQAKIAGDKAKEEDLRPEYKKLIIKLDAYINYPEFIVPYEENI